jgi:hypothetical protein
MDNFESLLDQLDITLRKHNSNNYEKLYPPLPKQESSQILNDFGINDENIKSFFSWKNGFDPDREANQECMIFYFGSFQLSLEAIAEHIKANKEQDIWPESFIPLIMDNTGQFILYNNKPGKSFGRLCLYSASLLIIEPEIIFDSVASMIRTTIESYEQRAQFYDPIEDWLDINFSKYRKIAKKINSESEFWRK